MEIINTKWGLNSYLELKSKHVVTDADYRDVLKPDVMLLLKFPGDEKFRQAKFWSVAEDHNKNIIGCCYKMKWHQIGNGCVQLRLLVMIRNTQCFLCEAYVKENSKTDKRKLAKFKVYAELIKKGQYTICGRWSNNNESAA